MRLAYGYPKNPLVADAFLRIAEFYYGRKEFMTAAYVYKRMLERFPDNQRADLVAYRMATAYYRAGLAGDTTGLPLNTSALPIAVRYYLEFSEKYPDHELADDALYWAANAEVKQMQPRRAYKLLSKQLVQYGSGDMKQYAIRLKDKLKEEDPNIDVER